MCDDAFQTVCVWAVRRGADFNKIIISLIVVNQTSEARRRTPQVFPPRFNLKVDSLPINTFFITPGS